MIAPEETQAIIDRVAKAKAAVIDWMNAEGDAGRLRQNSQAPGWNEYVAADAAFQALTNRRPE